MKKLIISLLVIAAFVVAPMSLFAEADATATGTAVLITPLSISQVADLNFGTVAAGETDGEAIVDNSSTPALHSEGGVDIVSETGASAARFTVNGANTTGFNVVCPTFTLGTTTLLTVTPDFEASATTSAAGTYTLYIGGSLAIPSNTTAGTYTGTFPVTVSYE